MENGDIFAVAGILFVLGFVLLVIIVSAWVWWRIVSKTGHSGWLSLLMWVPIANLVMLLILAFGEWPVHRELENLRRRVTVTS